MNPAVQASSELLSLDIVETNQYTMDALDASELLSVLKDDGEETKQPPKESGMVTTPVSKASKPLPARRGRKRKNVVSKRNCHEKKKEETPPVKPRRPLSAYNIFYKFERARLLTLAERGESFSDQQPCIVPVCDIRKLLSDNPYHVDHSKRPHRKSHGKVSFSDLFRIVLRNWKQLTAEMRAPFEEIADEYKSVYDKESQSYKQWKRRAQWRKTKARSRKKLKKSSKSAGTSGGSEDGDNKLKMETRENEGRLEGDSTLGKKQSEVQEAMEAPLPEPTNISSHDDEGLFQTELGPASDDPFIHPSMFEDEESSLPLPPFSCEYQIEQQTDLESPDTDCSYMNVFVQG
mmetsp:Transcript_21073/g.39462  ORF Transcript_21073/g.39462 Transcript_21073/m.39462 type:complete len:348 (-) Transcript_21073:255-1298(-)